jgi:hypothetical protein
MKTSLLTCLCSIALALTALGQIQTPPPSPSASATAVNSAGANISPSITPAVTPDSEDSIEAEVARKLKRKFGITITNPSSVTVDRRHQRNHEDFDFDDGAWMAVPIVAVIFSTLFGAPVLVVAAIMFFSYLKSRSLHRTVRAMVEKGEPVPAALFAPPPIVRARSDMRRGVILMMVGFALMIFFGAMNDWDGGAWAIGIIPFLIGLGYLLVWKLEGPKDKVPPLP